VARATPRQAEQQCSLKARRSLCHCLVVSTGELEFQSQVTVVSWLLFAGPVPAIGGAHEKAVAPEGDEPLESWQAALEQLLQRWV
jgi:hypothetical protein